MMSRWAWHEKNGVRNGPLLRSDQLTPSQEERIDHDRRQREYDYIEHPPVNEPMFKHTRSCDVCNDEKPQHDMHWVRKSWKCPRCDAAK